jgi:glucose/mannose-6-phosphate isomerase
VMEEQLAKLGVPCVHYHCDGENRWERMFRALYAGDWLSYYLAMEYGIDPTPVEIIEDFKKALESR